VKAVVIGIIFAACLALTSFGQDTQPLVAIHDSEFTRALESMPASGVTPTGPGTTGNQWWPTDWHYFVMPEAVKEALRSDGTAFTVLGDSNITAGVLVTNGAPKYPILISLASEAIRDDEIANFTNYVAAGGFLFVGSSAFTRNTNGTARADFAFANQLGVHKVVSGFTNWAQNNYFTKTNQTGHRLSSHIPNGQNTWRMPSSSEEIPWGISPSHPFLAPHDIWQVQATDATVLAQGDTTPFLAVKPYGKGYFIYCAAYQPLIGHSGFAPSMYAYVIFRRAIEWAFESANLPLPKLSPWPYQYDAAFMVRHDLENFTNEIAAIEASAQFEFTNGAKGDYYFCTGTLRDDASPAYNTNSLIAGMRRAVTNYGAYIGPHNGGLRNPNNPALVRGQYDYWHWGPDEALDVTPPGYPNGKAYASASISNSFRDVESWLSGITNGLRSWVACYFNGTREDSYDIQAQLGVKIAGDQKLTPFPHWTMSTLTPGKRYPFLTEPVSDWFVGGLVAQSLEPWHPPGVHTTQTLHDAIDFYFGMGALINFYSHSLSTGLGDAGALAPEYVVYSLNTNLHPRIWSANAASVYQWWLARSNAQISVSSTTNGYQTSTTFSIKGATDPNTSVELLIPGSNSMCSIQVITNGALAGASAYRTNGQLIKLRVGTAVTNAVISYFPISVSQIFSENFDTLTPPALPSGWTTSASGAQSAWASSASFLDTIPNSVISIDASNIGINELVSPPIPLGPGTLQLTFRNNYDLETGAGTDGFDGGVLEIKIGTNTFTDILAAGGNFASGGYTSTIDSAYGNPLAGRQAWSGTSAGFIGTVVNLPPAASGQTIQLRWRCGTDNGNARTGWRIDTVAINNRACMCCTVANTAPSLPSQTNRTIAELSTLTVANTATDSDIPANTLYYSLPGAPAGAAIDANGIITWTPGEAQGPSTNTFTTIVTDSGFPPLSATNSFTVTVTEVNSAPVLPAQNNRTMAELTTLTVTNTATDSDIPANTLSYTLLTAPTGATINSSGIINWTPTEAQGPGTNTITTVVTDNGSPPLSATNSFVVTVNEVNSAPILPAQANRSITALTTLVVTNAATDSDIPANSFTYSLTAPGNAVISANGVISWTPTLPQDRSTNLFRTVVTDNGSPPLSATNTFAVFVNSDPIVVLDSTSLVVEGCTPTNNAIDPGETVTMLFSLKNTGLRNTTNLVVTLLQTNGVVSPSAPQSFGALVAGGAAASQPFTFGSTGVCGGTVTANLQLQDNSANLGTIAVSFQLGQMSTVLTQNFDGVTVPALPTGWTTSATGVQSNWTTQSVVRDSLPNAAFSPDANNVGLNELVSPPITLPAGPAQLIFRNNYDLEAGPGSTAYDGGVLEIKVGTNGFADIVAAGGSFVSGGYTHTISGSFGNALGGRQAWSGDSGGFITTFANLPVTAENQVIQLRWRCGTDNGNGNSGWRIDSIGIAGYACCANSAPVLAAQSDRTIAELTTLTVTNTASDDPANTLTYSLVNPPSGAQIDANGVITWTPSEEQGPSTNAITTIVTDNGIPPLSATNSFTVTVTEVNSAPVLTVPPNQTINELTTLSVSASATDPDIPANSLSFSLLSPPAGMTIVPGTGAISWTPHESQGPSVNTITVVVTDNGSPPLSATNGFIVTVNEVNNAPILTVPPNQTIDELTTLSVSASATDPDLPANTLTFSLLAPPIGVTVNPTSGLINWTPSEAQGPSTNTITVVVTDNGSPPLSATNAFAVIVNEVNSPPSLPTQSDRTVNELSTLIVTNTATDPDLPANALAYGLLNPPDGMQIDTNGIVTWTPTEAQGPSTNIITVFVTDDGQPPLSSTNIFMVVVNEVNSPPVLPTQTNRTIAGLTSIIVTNTASDPDIPTNSLSYTLTAGPSNAVIDTNGVITWTPTIAQVPGTNVFTTVVTDSNPWAVDFQQLTATNTFVVVVTAIHNGPVLPVQTNRTIPPFTTLVVTNTAFDQDIPACHLTYTLVDAPSGAAIDSNGIITWTPGFQQAVVTRTFITFVTDDGTPSLSDTNSFSVTVNSPPPAPVIQYLTVTNGAVTIRWTAAAGHSYRLEYKDDFEDTNWHPSGSNILATQATAVATEAVGGASQRFYRVVLLP
jgi:Putative Ig domain/Bacterial Ig domain